MASLRISSIEKHASQMLTAENSESAMPLMSDRRGETPRGDVILTTNVYGVKMANTIVYRYDVGIQVFFQKQDGTENIYDLTNKIKGE